jgi:hypothetical protein
MLVEVCAEGVVMKISFKSALGVVFAALICAAPQVRADTVQRLQNWLEIKGSVRKGVS